MSDHMTVGDVIDALSRYDRDRLVVGRAVTDVHPISAVGSVEPNGVVFFAEDWGGRLDALTLNWFEYNR